MEQRRRDLNEVDDVGVALLHVGVVRNDLDEGVRARTRQTRKRVVLLRVVLSLQLANARVEQVDATEDTNGFEAVLGRHLFCSWEAELRKPRLSALAWARAATALPWPGRFPSLTIELSVSCFRFPPV